MPSLGLYIGTATIAHKDTHAKHYYYTTGYTRNGVIARMLTIAGY